MSGSQNSKKDIILSIYQSNRTVFRLNDIAIITGISDFQSLSRRVNYFVQTGKLLNPRKGIYAKPQYVPEELACSIYSPSYISLEYVLQKAGVIFQYDSGITSASYLRRSIEIESQIYDYRKLKSEILLNTAGIDRRDNVNIAVPERAFLDLLYLEKDYYIDYTESLNKEKVFELLSVYQVKTLSRRVKKMLRDA